MKRHGRAAILLLVLAGICGLSTAGHAAPVIIRLSTGAPEQHFITRQYTEWARLVEKNASGELQVQVYHSAQLFRDNEVIKAVATGAIEAGCAFTMYLENQLVPAMKIFQMPFFFNSSQEILTVIRSDAGAAMRKTAEQKGVKLLGLIMFPSPQDTIVMATKPIKVRDDVKGTVIRAVSPESSAIIKKWGAGPSFLTGAEVYMGLQRGTIHGAVNSVTTYVERKLYEVAPHAVFLPVISVHTFIAMNKSFFDRLTPGQQKAVLDASAAIEGSTEAAAQQAFRQDMEEAKQKAKLYHPTPAELAVWREGSEVLWDELSKGNKEVADTLKSAATLLKR
jgi:C4-dicarboxylate-binding protein DctP